MLVKTRRLYTPKYQQSGFTLPELLLAALIGLIVSGSILSLTTNVISDSQKEIARSKSQQQMKTALNYIAEELREAVYIYKGEQLDNKIIPYLPSFPNTKKPVLAFWKIESVPYDNTGNLPNDCASFADEDLKEECNSLKIERNTYTLVVYLQSTEDTVPKSWKGQSRLERYQLRKYSNTNTLTKNPGYADPRRETSFDNWPLDAEDTNQQTTGTISVATEPLVDFVYTNDSSSLSSLPDCITNTDTDKTVFASPTYDSADDDDYSRGFFACVSFVDQDLNLIPDHYQDVQIFLTGNAKGQTGYQTTDSLIPLETQVMTKGVIEKQSGD